MNETDIAIQWGFAAVLWAFASLLFSVAIWWLQDSWTDFYTNFIRFDDTEEGNNNEAS